MNQITYRLLHYEKNISFDKTLTSFRNFVQLRDLRERSQNTYVSHVNMIGQHFQADPVDLAEDQVRDYFVFLRQDKQYKPSTMNQAKVSLRTFFCLHLNVSPPWTVFDEIVVRHREQLPVVLAVSEVQLLLSKITEERFHAYFSLVYSCGLRLSEALNIEVNDIHTEDRKLHIRDGKGGKNRFVPISMAMIERLRQWWKFHQNPKFLFPAMGRRWRACQRANKLSEQQAMSAAMKKSDRPMSTSTVQNALKWAVAASDIKKRVSVHTLRHCYATHLLDKGVSLRYISNYLGHASLNQTLVYAHLSAVGEQRTQEILTELDQNVIGKQSNA